MLRLRHEADDRPDHFQVYTGQVRIGTIYKTSGNQWYWGLNGVQNGPGEAEYQSRRPRSTSSLTPILMEPPLRPRPWRPPSNRGLFLEVGTGYRGHQSNPQGERTPGRTQYTRFPLPWHYHPILPTDTRKNYKVPIRFHRK